MQPVNEYNPDVSVDFFSLRLFSVLAETGNFTRTAESLGLTQSAVSRHLQRLEEQIGARLFERTTRKARLTDAGKFLLDRSVGLLDSWQNSIQELRETYIDGPKRIRLALSETVGFSYLPGFVAAYKKERPEDLIELTQLPGAEIITEVLAQNREFGVVTDRGTQFPAEIEVTHRFSDKFVGISPPDPKANNVAQFFSAPFITLATSGSAIAPAMADYLKKQNRNPNIAMEAQGFDFIINLVSTGFGNAIVPIRALALYGKRKPVSRYPLPRPFSRELAIIARQDNQRPEHLSRFLKLTLF